MKVGDNVWVEVSRDRERAAKIKARNNDIIMVEFETGITEEYDITNTRLMSEPQTATKHDQEKNRLELIPASGIEAAGRAFTYGANKYKEHGDHNWANGFKWDRIIGSTLRHINAFRSGQDIDEESGLSHIDHAVASIMMLAAHIEEGLGEDNRRKVKAK